MVMVYSKFHSIALRTKGVFLSCMSFLLASLQMMQKRTPEMKRKLPELSKAVAVAVSKVVQAAQGLKGERAT